MLLLLISTKPLARAVENGGEALEVNSGVDEVVVPCVECGALNNSM